MVEPCHTNPRHPETAHARQSTSTPPAFDPYHWLSTMIYTPSIAEDIALLSIGPRIGFSEKTPLLGKEQKYYFHLANVAAVFKLPWLWPLGGSPWSLETRLITSAGLLTAAGESDLMMTAVPELALSGWDGLVTFDAGAGHGSSATTSSACKTSGVRFKSSRPWGSRQSIFSRLYRISRPTLLRCWPIRIVQSRRGHLHHKTWIPVLARTSRDWRSRCT